MPETAKLKGANGPRLDRVAFEKMRRIVPNLLEARRPAGRTGWQARPLPEEVSFKLTNRCDLRCEHCYQWNEHGYHHGLGGGDLSLSVIEKVLVATRPIKSNVYLWGGEPLVYRYWDGLVDLLEPEGRWMSICTNGTQIERRLESLARISDRLELVIALDGFETEHDALRGHGSFGKVVKALRALAAAKPRGGFRGETTVNCVIQPTMVKRLHAFVALLQDMGVDTVYLSFPWYLSDQTSREMDAHVAAHFPWLARSDARRKPSWHSYKFQLDPSCIPELSAELDAINATNWAIKVRYNPELGPADMDDFLSGSSRPAQKKTRCTVHRTRMDILPSGQVVSCKFFPEFAVGDLNDAEVQDVWRGERFDQVRATIASCGLMPVCAKCNLLYTRGV